MEYFDVLDKDGNKTGIKKERTLVHKDGDFHASVHIWIFKGNKTLLQKRCKFKDSFPLCFDAACTGHVDFSETPLKAAVREISEELGLNVKENDLTFLFRQMLCVKKDSFVSNEFNYVYVLTADFNDAELSFQKEEIDMLLWIDKNILSENLKNDDKTYCIKYDEFLKVMGLI